MKTWRFADAKMERNTTQQPDPQHNDSQQMRGCFLQFVQMELKDKLILVQKVLKSHVERSLKFYRKYV